MEKQKIIAILGLSGSGKTETINYLMNKFNCKKVYFGDVTFDEMKKRNLKINEKNERMIREDLRKKYGQLYYAKQIIKKINKISNNYILVESLYSWPEYLLFKKTFADNFITIAIYSSPQIRYKRLSNRKTRPLTAEEAKSRDYAQIENLTQANPIAMASHTINNNSNFKNLYNQIDNIIKNI